MFGMMNLMGALHGHDWQAKAKAGRTKRLAATTPLDWHDGIAWAEELYVSASTYKPLSLFEVESIPPRPTWRETRVVRSPNGRFCYAEMLLPAMEAISIYKGSRRGKVIFDGPVVIPSLFEANGSMLSDEAFARDAETDRYFQKWGDQPWMSITPMEIMTLRTGTKLAKGSVVVVGLGLGHQLIEVSKRKQVTHLTLVEKSQALIDWLLPRIEPHLGRKLDEVIVGDAYTEVPKLEADVALVDIFPAYGNNGKRANRIVRNATKVQKVWAWGTAPIA